MVGGYLFPFLTQNSDDWLINKFQKISKTILHNKNYFGTKDWQVNKM